MWRWLLTGQRHGPWYWLFRKDPPEVIWAEHAEIVLASLRQASSRHAGRGFGGSIVAREPSASVWAALAILSTAAPTCAKRRMTTAFRGPGVRKGNRIRVAFRSLTPIRRCSRSEATYLARLGLLEPGERERIPRVDFSQK